MPMALPKSRSLVSRRARRSRSAITAWPTGTTKTTCLPSVLLMALIELAEKLWTHKASVTEFTFLVETPCTYISANVPTSAFSER